MNLFHKIVESRARIGIAVAIFYALLLAPAVPIADWIRNESTSPMGNVLIMTGWLFLSLPASYLLGILIGDLIFPDRWRERVILGREIKLDEDDELAAIRAVRTFKMPFYLMVVLLLFGSAMMVDVVTGGFLTDYQKHGHFRTTMRGEDDTIKLQLIKDLAEKRLKDNVVDAVEQLELVWRDLEQSKTVRLAALKVLGQQAASVVSSVDEWNEDDNTSAKGRWETELWAKLRHESSPELLRLYELGQEDLARSAGLVLGKLREDSAVEPMLAYLEGNQQITSKWKGTVAALGLLHEMTAMERLVKLVRRTEDLEGFKYLAWAIGELSKNFEPDEDKVAPPVFDEIIELYGEVLASGSGEKRCVAADLLFKLGHAAVADKLFEAFDAKGVEFDCKPYYIDTDLPAPLALGGNERLRRRILKAFTYIGQDPRVFEWLEVRLGDKSRQYPSEVRNALRSLLGSAKRQR